MYIIKQMFILFYKNLTGQQWCNLYSLSFSIFSMYRFHEKLFSKYYFYNHSGLLVISSVIIRFDFWS